MNTTNENDGEPGHRGVMTAVQASVQCPACGTRGKAVKPITVESLVVEETRLRLGRPDGFFFCAAPSCAVAYFQPDTGARVSKGEVRVRIGQKEAASPRPVCYCFDHTIEEIEAEVARSGASKVAEDITEKCRRGLDRCEETNPQGSCCLGNVRRAIKEAQARHASGSPSLLAGGDAGAGEDCCVVPKAGAPAGRAPRSKNAGLWATAGAVVSAVLSSACCWLPLLLIAFGASAAGVAGFFEAYRPYLLGATGLLLASGFYLAYVRKERCGPGEACAIPNPRLRRLNKVTLWVATAVVLAFAIFPNYVGLLLRGDHSGPVAASPAPGSRTVHFAVSGMTCAACASGLQARLRDLPGVDGAQVDIDSAVATVTLAPGGSVEAVLRTIAEQGFEGRVKGPAGATAPRR